LLTIVPAATTGFGRTNVISTALSESFWERNERRERALRSFRTLWVVSVVSVLGLVAAACSSSNNNTGGTSNKGGTVKIAYQGALTGGAAQLVIPGFNAVKLAFDQANSGKFGNLPVKVEVVGEDTTGSPTQAPAIANKVASDSSFVGVIGPAFSGESLAAGPIYDGAGIPFVTASATRTSINQQGWARWFRANANDDEQGPAAGDYIGKVMKPNCAFVTSDDSAYGTALAATVQTGVTNNAIPVTAEIRAVATGQTDFSALVTKIQASGCKAVFYGGYSPEAELLRPQMTQAGLTDVTLVGGDGIKDTDYTSKAGSAGEGTIATCPCVDITKSTDPAAKTFISDFTAKYNTPPGIYAAEYYDVARMYIEAFKQGKTTRAALTQYFDTVHYTGLTKPYVFLTNHELNQADVKIFIWKDEGGNWTFVGDAAELSA
jgi:branched-chain amino acid transport system substrate-binding protein